MAITDTLKRAPKWAWVTAAGVGIGAGVIKLYQGRAVEDDGDPTGGTTPVGGAQQVGTAPPAVIVPPIITGASGDQGSAVAGMATWADAVGDLMGNYASIVAQSVGGITDIAGQSNDALVSLATAGGAPGQAVQNPTPLIINVPLAQPAPVPVAKTDRVVKRCKRSYNGQSNNCRLEVTDVYASGKRKIVSDQKVSDKPCGNPHTECHAV